jgi:hypothetical protein
MAAMDVQMQDLEIVVPPFAILRILSFSRYSYTLNYFFHYSFPSPSLFESATGPLWHKDAARAVAPVPVVSQFFVFIHCFQV